MKNRVDFLRQFAEPGTIGIEIGVWKGDFSESIIKHVNPSELHLVDPWLFNPEYTFAWYGLGRVRNQKEMDEIAASVVTRFNDQISSGHVQIHRGSIDMVEIDKADWIYIDGDHTFEAVKRDIAVSKQFVGATGILVFDDYKVNGWWADGVTRAIHTYVDTNELTIIEEYKNQCACRFLSI